MSKRNPAASSFLIKDILHLRQQSASHQSSELASSPSPDTGHLSLALPPPPHPPTHLLPSEECFTCSNAIDSYHFGKQDAPSASHGHSHQSSGSLASLAQNSPSVLAPAPTSLYSSAAALWPSLACISCINPISASPSPAVWPPVYSAALFYGNNTDKANTGLNKEQFAAAAAAAVATGVHHHSVNPLSGFYYAAAAAAAHNGGLAAGQNAHLENYSLPGMGYEGNRGGHPHRNLSESPLGLQHRPRSSSSGSASSPGHSPSGRSSLSQSGSAAAAAANNRKIRRNRTVFTELQLMGLERRFDSQKYLSTPDRADLARVLGLTQLQVKTWYQNRRMKWKKQVMQGGCPIPPTKPKGRPKKNSIPSLGMCIETTQALLATTAGLKPFTSSSDAGGGGLSAQTCFAPLLPSASLASFVSS